MHNPWNTAVAGLAVLLSGFLFVSAVRADDTPSSPGVWQRHQYSFAYMGFTSTYSCDGLADKLKKLLVAAGARKDAKATSGACPGGYGHPDKLARADLTFYTLAPDTSGTAADGQQADGTWRPFAISARSPRDLALGDCELVEQFVSNVLPLFAVRNIDNRTTCVPHELSGSVIDLKFEAFAAVAPPPGHPAPAAPHAP
jgi:hypothetical protein